MVSVQIPEDLAAEIDDVSKDRSGFVADAVRQALRDRSTKAVADEVARINAVADELNDEASDVLEYQVVQ